jgi:crossover junction endodeoxyribonuclease RuvC
MIVLGIDPGSRRAGIAVIEQTSPSSPLTMLMAETLRLESLDHHTARLLLIHDSVEEAIRLHKPNLMTIETPVYGLDPLAMLKLGRAQASAILAASRHDLEVREMYPKAVKKAITGNGNASKEQVAGMVQTYLPGQELPTSKDATDAMAIALCGIFQGESMVQGAASQSTRTKGNWSEFVKDNPSRVRPS